jgi:hypothetical protein
VTREHCLKGYILATPRRDYKSLTAFLDKKHIDYSGYLHLLRADESREETARG